MTKKELFTESEWLRVAPDWVFWNKQRHKILTCTKCGWKTTINQRYNRAVITHMTLMRLQLQLALHAEEHRPVKKAKKTAKKK